MKARIIIALFACLALGCSHLTKGHKAVSLSFRRDPIDHRAEEAIEQIAIIVPSANVHSVGKMPTDWSASVGKGQDGAAECTMNCAHQSFAEPDIHVFDGLVRFMVKPTNGTSEVKVRVWITRGPLGSGRIIDLYKDDFVLR